MKHDYQFENGNGQKDTVNRLEGLDVSEVSLVPTAANRRRFLMLKADEEPREKPMTYAQIEAMAKDLIAKSAEPMSTAQAVARLMERNPALYEAVAVEQDSASEEPSTPARTSAVFKSAFEASGEPDFAAFVTKALGDRPELAVAWYQSSLDNAD